MNPVTEGGWPCSPPGPGEYNAARDLLSIERVRGMDLSPLKLRSVYQAKASGFVKRRPTAAERLMALDIPTPLLKTLRPEEEEALIKQVRDPVKVLMHVARGIFCKELYGQWAKREKRKRTAEDGRGHTAPRSVKRRRVQEPTGVSLRLDDATFVADKSKPHPCARDTWHRFRHYIPRDPETDLRHTKAAKSDDSDIDTSLWDHRLAYILHCSGNE